VFYAFLAQVYDHIVNPGHWTPSMRSDALAPLKLAPTHRVVDVGAGTGFCTQGVVAAGVPPTAVTMVDQSPHQLSKARRKADLKGVTILEGDAEAVSLASDAYDRYVSAGSIEYWPDPQMGIAEAYRLVKPGGLACVIGPVRPTHPVSRAFADAWMLFPEEREYYEWFEKAGFVDVSLTRIGPPWYRGVRRHGLIMGCSVVGRKPMSGPSPYVEAQRKAGRGGVAVAEIGKRAARRNPLAVAVRVVLGSLAGFYYFVLPVYMWLKNLVWPKGWAM
jgi:MPBQ/MSBQ methyltransferase